MTGIASVTVGMLFVVGMSATLPTLFGG